MAIRNNNEFASNITGNNSNLRATGWDPKSPPDSAYAAMSVVDLTAGRYIKVGVVIGKTESRANFAQVKNGIVSNRFLMDLVTVYGPVLKNITTKKVINGQEVEVEGWDYVTDAKGNPIGTYYPSKESLKHIPKKGSAAHTALMNTPTGITITAITNEGIKVLIQWLLDNPNNNFDLSAEQVEEAVSKGNLNTLLGNRAGAIQAQIDDVYTVQELTLGQVISAPRTLSVTMDLTLDKELLKTGWPSVYLLGVIDRDITATQLGTSVTFQSPEVHFNWVQVPSANNRTKEWVLDPKAMSIGTFFKANVVYEDDLTGVGKNDSNRAAAQAQSLLESQAIRQANKERDLAALLKDQKQPVEEEVISPF